MTYDIEQNVRLCVGSRNTSRTSAVTQVKSPCTSLIAKVTNQSTPYIQLFFSWGQSAGAIAVGHHMITNGGNPEGLFRAAIMNSGSPYSILDVADPVPAQNAYNTFVGVVGCSNSTDTLACLRQAPVAKIQAGMDASSGLYSYTVCLKVILLLEVWLMDVCVHRL